jgi:hypothetical protein
MKNLLDYCSCNKPFERIDLTVRTAEVAQKIVGFMGDKRVRMETVRHKVYEALISIPPYGCTCSMSFTEGG